MNLEHNNPCTVFEHVTHHNGAENTNHDAFKDFIPKNLANYVYPSQFCPLQSSLNKTKPNLIICLNIRFRTSDPLSQILKPQPHGHIGGQGNEIYLNLVTAPSPPPAKPTFWPAPSLSLPRPPYCTTLPLVLHPRFSLSHHSHSLTLSFSSTFFSLFPPI